MRDKCDINGFDGPHLPWGERPPIEPGPCVYFGVTDRVHSESVSAARLVKFVEDFPDVPHFSRRRIGMQIGDYLSRLLLCRLEMVPESAAGRLRIG
jgi:hypothetical protein